MTATQAINVSITDAQPISVTVSGGTFGDVDGPSSATDNAIARFDGTTGSTIQNSAVLIDDSGNVTGVVNISATGGEQFGYSSKTSNYTITSTDSTINCTSGTFTVTLPTAIGVTGRRYCIKNTGSGIITLATTSSQTIDAQLTKTLAQYDSYIVISNGSNWVSISSHISDIGRSEIDAVQFGLIPSTGEPSLAVAQANGALLTSLLSSYRVVRIAYPGDYYFAGTTYGGAFTFPSTYRELFIGPGVRIIRHSGWYGGPTPESNRKELFRMANETAGANEGIKIYGGGTIGRTYASESWHTCRIVNPGKLHIEDITFQTDINATGTNSAGKFCALINGVTDGVFKNIVFKGNRTITGGSTISAASDGLHFYGKNSNIRINGISGDCGDNMIALSQGDYYSYEDNGVADSTMVEGNIENISIENVQSTSGSLQELIRAFGRPPTRTALSLTGCSWNNTTKTLTKTGGFTSYAFTSGDKIYIVSGTNTIAGWYTVQSRTDDNNIVLDRSIQSYVGAASNIVTSWIGNGWIRNVRIKGVKANETTNAIGFVDDNGGGHSDPALETVGIRMDEIIIEDSTFKVPSYYGGVVITSTGIEDITLKNCSMHPDAGDAAYMFITSYPGGYDTPLHLKTVTLEGCKYHFGKNGSSLVAAGKNFDNLRVMNCFYNYTKKDGGGGQLISVNSNANYPVYLKTCDISNTIIKNDAQQVTYAIRINYGQIEQCYGSNVSIYGLTYFLKGSTLMPNNRTQCTIINPKFFDVNDGYVGSTYTLVDGQADLKVGGWVRNYTGGALSSNETYNPTITYLPTTRTFNLNYTDFSGGSSTPTVDIGALTRFGALGYLPRGARVTRVRIRTLTTFAGNGGSLSAVTVDVGDTSSYNRYISAFGPAITSGSENETAVSNQLSGYTSTPGNIGVRLNLTGSTGAQLTAGRLLVTVEFAGEFG